jgi:Pyruvate/2-oxoacid:ferredoxin oxidoreductase gamma subunit/pyruvate/2-oxoacid:ferredoxin oxidoreductase beta subunit
VLGGLYNGLVRALARLGFADAFGAPRIPLYVMNVAYPLVPEEVRAFCAGKRAVLVVEEGFPDYVEQAITVELRRADLQTRVFGKGCLPKAGEYVSEVLLQGLAAFIRDARPYGAVAGVAAASVAQMLKQKASAVSALGDLPPRPPTFCTGCPERPVFSAIKLAQREVGPTHISADIGCHSFATFAPFSMGNSILGYGMSLASAAAVTPNLDRRPIAVMGDGGFWHNGLITGVASNLFNKNDGVLIVMQNGYTSATGQQFMPSSVPSGEHAASGMDIEQTLRAMGVKWLRKVRTYGVAAMVTTLKEALRTPEPGLKVIIADGECQLARQRRVRADDARRLRRGKRVVQARYGVDEEICTGDHSCIRLSGCPSLTVKPNPDPLRTDPVATVVESCVGCGLCGEVAHAAVLCPSFHRAEIVRNPSLLERWAYRSRRWIIGWLAGSAHSALTRVGENPAPDAAPDPGPRLRGDEPGQTASRPFTLLIAALGGEGGGVLTQWIVSAAASCGLPVQSTSIPGVAQRTGATTYYIEIWPQQVDDLGGRRPVLALAPGIGDVDLLVASELLEAGRAVAGGFVTPDRTRVIASSSRANIVTEKMAMGDGRYDPERLRASVTKHGQQAVLFDMEAVARQSGAMINAVMLGAIAAHGDLPIAPEAFEAAIRRDGKAVENNLRGFRAGFDAAHDGGKRSVPQQHAQAAVGPDDLTAIPPAARAIVAEGVRRLTAYQDPAYARLYRDRLHTIGEADARAKQEGRLLAAAARHLAVRMSYEDVIRVAQAKIAASRRAGIERSMQVPRDGAMVVTEFLKPGLDELCSVLPPRFALRVLAAAARRPRLAQWHWEMQVKTTSLSGFLRFWLLAKLRRFRLGTFRYQQEQAAIDAWLGLIVDAARLSPDLALEVADCARLIKGYGDTHKRGVANYRIIEAEIVRPALAGHFPAGVAADAVASAREAALRDPDGEALARCLAELGGGRSLPIAAE